ncbi:transcription antitermination factor NusB [Chryseomicrobium sp. FSL W7-1435]|uniref:transcription antitermination factor NusB n=1 Tax=Chryseomicrobium sp. FSL W7-1435 TaxID=2921704 RepID=UPI0031599A8A
MKRREAREHALRVLFQLDHSEMNIHEAMLHVTEEQDVFYDTLVNGTLAHREEIDNSLEEKLENWSLNRLPKIERTILRMAVFELEHTEDTPKPVIINEAIELTKAYGDEQSSRFVNGVLSKYINK